MTFFHQFFIAMVAVSQNAPSINLRHFVSVRRSRNFGRARKTASKKQVSKNRCGSGRGARARSRLGIWYRGNGMIMLRKAICHVRYINILTWLRGFQDKLLSICCCFLCVQVSFGNSETKETLRSSNFDPKASEHVRILIHVERGLFEQKKKLCKRRTKFFEILCPLRIRREIPLPLPAKMG